MSSKNVVTDPRFNKVHNDPRFARNSKKKSKVQLDKRFSAVLTDEKFQSVQGKYDKYGRRIKKEDNEMNKFYNLEEDDDDEDETATSKATSKKPMTAAERRIAYLNKRARGELSGESSSSSDSSTSDDDDEDELNVDDEDASREPQEDIPLGEETKRFAVMNCDWSRMRAVDLFALFESFLPASGIIEDVTIYPSDFGLARMAEEEKHGPKGLWAEPAKKDDDDEDEDDSEDDSDVDENDPLGLKKAAAEEDDGFDKEKLRQFELEKLRYYYAVATFNTVAAASAVFDACDGLEYETSSNTLDLRFVPDDVTFTNTPKESAKSVPDTYKPAIFATLALQSTELECTWDQDDGERLEKLTRQANWKDMRDDDFEAFVASEGSSGDGGGEGSDGEDVEAIKKRYRKALLGSDNEDNGDDDDDDGNKEMQDEEGDMEMTFNDATDVLKAKKQRDIEANETPFEKYQREKKHEKNLKKHEKRQKAKEAQKAQLETLKQAKKSKKKDGAAAAAVEEEEDDARDFDMKVIGKLEKHKDKKGKRHKKELEKLKATASGLQQGFAFNAEDERFAQLVTNNPDFSLDPTDSRFKKTQATEAIFETRRKKTANGAIAEPNNSSDAKPINELTSIVENLKRKAKDTNKPNKKPNRF